MSSTWGLIARAVPVLVVLVGTLVAFGAGVDVSERSGLPEAPALVQLYYAVGLFVLGGVDLGVPTGGPDWARTLLWATYFLGPAITTTAVAEGAIRMADPQWLGRVLHREHVVVVGTGRLARLYADAVLAEDPGRRVVPVDLEGFRRADQRAALRLDQAHAVVLAADDDLGNLGAAWEVVRAHPGARVAAHVAEIGLRRGSTALADASRVDVFNSHEVAATELYDETLAAHFRRTHERDVVAMLGFGRFGQTVLRHLHEHAAGEVERVVLVDVAAARIHRQYAEQVPFDPACLVQTIDADARDPATWVDLARALADAADPVVLLATDDDTTNVQAAVGLRKRLPKARLFVRCFADSAFVEEVTRRYQLEPIPVERMLREALRQHYRALTS